MQEKWGKGVIHRKKAMKKQENVSLLFLKPKLFGVFAAADIHIEKCLADADVFRRNLDQFIIADIFKRGLEIHIARRV